MTVVDQQGASCLISGFRTSRIKAIDMNFIVASSDEKWGENYLMVLARYPMKVLEIEMNDCSSHLHQSPLQ